MIAPGEDTSYYGYIENKCGNYQPIGVKPQSPLLSKLTQFIVSDSTEYDSVIVSFNANYNNYQYSKMNINVSDYSDLLLEYDGVYIVELNNITGDSENIKATTITNIDIGGMFKAASELNNSGISCNLEISGNFQ